MGFLMLDTTVAPSVAFELIVSTLEAPPKALSLPAESVPLVSVVAPE